MVSMKERVLTGGGLDAVFDSAVPKLIQSTTVTSQTQLYTSKYTLYMVDQPEIELRQVENVRTDQDEESHCLTFVHHSWRQ